MISKSKHFFENIKANRYVKITILSSSSLILLFGLIAGLYLLNQEQDVRKKAATTIEANYYVSPDGNDANPGTKSLPWRTIQKAANTLVAGETVSVLAGNYGESVRMTRSGVGENARIRFVADGLVTLNNFSIEANYVELNGFTLSSTYCDWNSTISIKGSYNLIQNNTVKDSTRQGIGVLHPSNGVILRKNTVIRANVNGFIITGTNHIIEDNDIADIRDHIGTCSFHMEANAIDFHGSGHIIRRNYIHDFLIANQNGSPHIDAFQTYSDLGNNKPAAKDVLIEGNKVFMGDSSKQLLEEGISGTQGIHAFMIEGTTSDICSNLTIKDNIIESWGGINGNPVKTNIRIYNNIWRSSLNIPSSYWPSAINLSGVTGYEIYNNIFVDYSYSHIIIQNGTTGGSYDHNIFWNSDGSTPRLDGYTVAIHDKRGIDPKFVVNFSDLHPQSTSPSIDTGYNLSTKLKSLFGNEYIDYDIEGNTRSQEDLYDIGAYKFSTNSITPEPIITATPSPTPTPTLKPTATPTLKLTATPIPTAIVTPTPNINELIVDNKSADFTTISNQDAWIEYINNDIRNFNGSHHFNSSAGTGSDRATWSFIVPKPGRYQIYAWWWDGLYRPTDVPYTINHLYGSTTVEKDQTINGGRWNILGTYDFSDHGSVFVTDEVTNGKDIVADAIRLVYIGALPTLTPTPIPPTPTTVADPIKTTGGCGNGKCSFWERVFGYCPIDCK